MTAEFSCSLCGKSFDKSKSQIRHSSYCRKKAKNPPKPRKRSCLRCTKAKTHCNTEYPSCSRCLEKDFTCNYQPTSRNTFERDSGQSLPQNEVRSSRASPPSAASTQLSLVQYYGDSDSYDSGAFNRTDDYIFQTQDFLNGISSIYDGMGDVQTGDLVSFASIPQNAVESHPITFQDPAALATSSLLLQPAFRAPRSFEPKQVNYRHLSLSRKYIICTLSAFPHMLSPGNSLPPFVHPHCLAKELNHEERGDPSSLPGPLSICAGIIAMLSVRNKNNSAFIWRAIYMEQQRLWEECSDYNDWDAVAALQAITIYFLLRLSEKDEDVVTFDIPLIMTMTKLSLKVTGVTSRHCQPSSILPPTWEGWILAESLRRTFFILLLVCNLFHISAGTDPRECDYSKHICDMQLPCTKKLWNAQSKSEWEQEYLAQANLNGRDQYSPLTFRDLLEHDVELNPRGDLLDRWLAHVDDFGTVVVAAASTGIGN